MVMKNPIRKIGLLLVTLSLLTVASAQTNTDSAAGKNAAYDKALLSAVVSLADAHLLQTQHTLEILARTTEVQSGQWKQMERLVSAAPPPALPQVLWFVQPDGTYYTSDGGLARQKLTDRAYFPKLMAGATVCGDLVVSKSTGKKSVIIAVPVVKDGKTVGGIGASIFVDDLSQRLNDGLKLPTGSVFYALTTNAVTAFHINPKLDFVDPRQLDSPSLAQAVGTMLSQPSGEVTYEYNGTLRHMYFSTSPLTGWRVAFGRILPGAGASSAINPSAARTFRIVPAAGVAH